MRSFFARVARAEPDFLHMVLRPVAGTYAAGCGATIGVLLLVSGVSGFVGMVALMGGGPWPRRICPGGPW